MFTSLTLLGGFKLKKESKNASFVFQFSIAHAFWKPLGQCCHFMFALYRNKNSPEGVTETRKGYYHHFLNLNRKKNIWVSLYYLVSVGVSW